MAKNKQGPNLDAAVLDSFPPVDAVKLQHLLEAAVAGDKHKIIVLDDDPTGVQTVHDLSVYTDWSYDSVRQGFLEEAKMFYILTNSRGFTEAETIKAHQEIARTVSQVARELEQPFLLVNRSDSTLRGHYPLETQILKEQWENESGQVVDGEILCPYFKEGGRFTIGNVHYVRYGEQLVPAGETEFAKDKTFGYSASDLTAYVEEKTGGAYRSENVTTISLEELRSLQVEAITAKLLRISGFGKVVVNAVDACDVKVFCLALYQALGRGKSFLFRTAAGLVKELGAVSDRSLLTREDMLERPLTTGGIVVVGSHTLKTTQQLERLKELPGICSLEFNSDLVLEEDRFDEEIEAVLQREEALLQSGKTVVVYTKRKLLSMEGESKEAALRRSVKISDAVQSLVGKLRVTPAFVVAKGGITSSDIGTKALQVKRARVLGQVRPGIPVWQTGEESKFPRIPYVIFPGNVGEADTLKEVVSVLMG
nr:four-carbon acid sugar kinase family protein [uncultured Anaeromusa sp.]